MTKLRLSALPDDKPVKLTVELPAAVHRDLVAYAEILAQTSRDAVSPDPAKLVAPMLQRFMATDKAFRRRGRNCLRLGPEGR
jgi:hypothetical protein